MPSTSILRSRRLSAAPRRRAARGISLVELIVVMAILGALLAFGLPAVRKILRRTEGSSALSGIARVLNTARVQAIKGVSGATAATPPAPVVVLVSKGGEGQQIRLRSFIDLVPANAPNYAEDAGDRIIEDVVFPGSVRFWKQGEAADDLETAVRFDSYRLPGTTTDLTLDDRVVFLPTGGISPPRDSDSAPPTATDGRGIYFADRDGLNFFRVTIPSDAVARTVTEKWVDSTGGYAVAGWSWK